MLAQKRRMPKDFFVDQTPKGTPVMHSKAVASEKSAMVGSHNYVERGVKFGTPELVLLRDDPNFAQQVGNFILNQVQKAKLTNKRPYLLSQS
jgi:hypothetical protein